jgi:hypothetical protein
MGAISIRIAYGYELEDGPQEDPYLAMFKTVADNFAISKAPATFMIDIVPACERLTPIIVNSANYSI